MTSEEASSTDLTKAKKSGKLSVVTSLFTRYFSSNKKDKDAVPKKSPKPAKKTEKKSKTTKVEEFAGVEETETLTQIKRIKPPPNRRRPITRRSKSAKVQPLFLTETPIDPDDSEVKIKRTTTAPLVFKRPQVMQELSNSLNSMNSSLSSRKSQDSQKSETKIIETNADISKAKPPPPSLPTGKKPVFSSASSSRSSSSSSSNNEPDDKLMESQVKLRKSEITVKNGKSASCPVPIESSSEEAIKPKVQNQRSSDAFTQRLKSHESASSSGIENPTSL